MQLDVASGRADGVGGVDARCQAEAAADGVFHLRVEEQLDVVDPPGRAAAQEDVDHPAHVGLDMGGKGFHYLAPAASPLLTKLTTMAAATNSAPAKTMSEA